MAKRKTLSYKLYLMQPDGSAREIEKLPEDALQRMGEKLSKTMSAYFTAHPDEYLHLIDVGVIHD